MRSARPLHPRPPHSPQRSVMPSSRHGARTGIARRSPWLLAGLRHVRETSSPRDAGGTTRRHGRSPRSEAVVTVSRPIGGEINHRGRVTCRDGSKGRLTCPYRRRWSSLFVVGSRRAESWLSPGLRTLVGADDELLASARCAAVRGATGSPRFRKSISSVRPSTSQSVKTGTSSRYPGWP